ncbi:MAG TPA: dihydrofolate reductase family protein [Phototrophicaceae bacterium]|jgi:dihydrofolate reductase|nr:dihydrofolate reductase family protein [Phototrophicaceae bacterium]
MAKLIYLMHTSLDGYVEDEQGNFDWSAPSEEVNTCINEVVSSFGTQLYGRKMYDSMVYWEAAYAANNHSQFHLDFAQLWQADEKIVYSRTVAEPRSARTRIEREFDPDMVRRLKADAGHDMSINGPELAAHALRAGLVDEVQMFVHPVIVGGGKRFFPDGVRSDLQLIEERAFRNGIIAVRYAIRYAVRG